MSLLTAPKSAQSNSQFITDGNLFGAGAERVEGSPGFILHEDSIDELRDHAAANRVDSVYGSGDLTMYAPEPSIQRDPVLLAEQAFPIDPSTKGYWGKFVDLLDISKFGQADFVNRTSDFQIVDFEGRSFRAGFATIGIGWRMRYEDYKQDEIAKRNFNQESQKKNLCILAMRQMAERIAFQGAATRQILGVLNNPFIPRLASTVEFSSASTPTQIQQMIALAEGSGYLNTQGAAMRPNAVIGSMKRIDYLRKRVFSTTGDDRAKILDVALEGTGITQVFEAPYMDSVGPAGKGAMLFYRRDRASISWHYPVSYEFLPVFKGAGYETIQLCIGRVGSVWPMHPEDTLLLTGI